MGLQHEVAGVEFLTPWVGCLQIERECEVELRSIIDASAFGCSA